MSRRSQVNQQRAALNQPLSFALDQRGQESVPLGLGQLVDVLIRQGAPRGWKLQTSDDPKVVRLIATCGPLELPLDFTPAEAGKLSNAILNAVEAIDPLTVWPNAIEPPLMGSAEAEALLSEYIAAAGGPKCPNCQRCLRHGQLVNDDGKVPGKYYCYPCQMIVDLSKPTTTDAQLRALAAASEQTTSTCTSCYREVVDAPAQEQPESTAPTHEPLQHHSYRPMTQDEYLAIHV